MIIREGDVIQVKPRIPAWGGCLMEVEEVKKWGVLCGMRLPGREEQRTYLRLNHSEYNLVGHVTFMNDDMKEKTE